HVGELGVDLFLDLGNRLGARGALGGGVLQLRGAGDEELALAVESDDHAIVRLRHPWGLLWNGALDDPQIKNRLAIETAALTQPRVVDASTLRPGGSKSSASATARHATLTV